MHVAGDAGDVGLHWDDAHSVLGSRLTQKHEYFEVLNGNYAIVSAKNTRRSESLSQGKVTRSTSIPLRITSQRPAQVKRRLKIVAGKRESASEREAGRVHPQSLGQR